MIDIRKPACGNLSVLFLLITVVTVSLHVSCGGSSGSKSDSDLDKNFLRDAATVQASGLSVYWLGHGFTAGGVTFDGPYGSGLGMGEPGEITLNYVVWLEATPLWGPTVSLALTIYNRDTWSKVENQFTNPRLPGVTRRTATVRGKEASLLLLPLGERQLNSLELIVDLGDAVVLGDVHADASSSPGEPDRNPLINDPDLLVQVMQDLRPYPQ